MAKKWSEVQQNPEYQALPPDKQESARQEYFSSVVAPQVPKEQIGAARAEFDAKTRKVDDTWGGDKPVGNMDATFGGQAEELVKGMANPLNAMKGFEKLEGMFGNRVQGEATGMGAPPQVAGALGAGAQVLPDVAMMGNLLTKQGIKAAATGIEAIPGAIKAGYEGASNLLGKAKTLGGDVLGTLRGTEIPKSQEAATNAARKVMQAQAEAKESASHLAGRVGSGMENTKEAMEAQLQADKNSPVPHLGKQGEQIRNEVKSVTDTATVARRTTADTEFKSVKATAAAKEAAGGRVNTEQVQKSLTDLKDKVGAIPELSAQVDKFIKATQGTRTFDELEYARRYLNDVAYSGPLEGYGSIVKNAAREASHSLDQAMQEFVPEFKKYKDNYAKMSEPLDAMNTRLGKAIHGTEGGLSDDIYSKVEAQTIPDKLFSKAGGIDTLTDMLAGGKNAPKEAREAAAKKVDAMLENWLLKTAQGKGSADQAIKHLTSPQMEATLSGQPAGAKVIGKLKETAKQESQVKELDEFSEKVIAQSKKDEEAAKVIRDEIARADNIAKGASDASKKEALNIYLSALKKGNLDSPQYKAAIHLIDRAHTLEEKTARAQKYAKWIGAGGAIAAEEAIRRHL